jgi:hypothetical protein
MNLFGIWICSFDGDGVGMLKLETTMECVDWNELAALYSSEEEIEDSSELIQKFEKSSQVRFLYSEGRLVGAGRALTDGEWYAAICDVTACPRCKDQSMIQQEIVQSLMECFPGTFDTVRPTGITQAFYFKQGFESKLAEL